MAIFRIGSKVVHISNGQRGTIIEVFPACRGRQLYKVDWGNMICDELETNMAIDCDISDPYERCAKGLFGSYSEYAKKNTTFKIKNSNNSTLSSLKASKTLFRAYQFKPLLKFINSPTRRLLVADEVGLGKTIEAGHILLELKARKQLRNVLVVCPISLQEKWKAELIEKFGLSFKIYENTKDLIADLSDHRGDVRAIINYEKIRMKRDDEDDKKTKKEGKKKRKKDPINNLIDYLMIEGSRFSFVLCDEAHKMRNSTTQTYKGAEVIMSMTDASIFLTATPIMISTENLYNLLHLLDGARYFNYQIFDNLLQQNKPFIKALSNLNRKESLPSIAEELSKSEIRTKFSADEKDIYNETTTVGEKFKNDPIFGDIIAMMNGEDTMPNRARIQYLLSTMSIMNNVFSRTRKREISTDYSQAERKPHFRKIILSEYERKEFDKIIDNYIEEKTHLNEEGERILDQGAILGLIQKKRQVASSVFAYLNNEDKLSEGIDLYSNYPDTKIDELIKIIEEVFLHGTRKIVIFALFRKTLDYINIRLKSKGYGCLMIHGQIDNRPEILDQFKNDPNAHILLSSEVGSEGLDMQFCNSMVNYDLPWNPMVVEQRIGRIDRFGQQSPTVNIYNLVVADSIQEDIYMRLLDRIGIFKDTIGDLEAILDASFDNNNNLTIQDVYNKLEKELYVSKLTPEERRRKIDEISQAFENERENIRQLEEGLTNTLTNDAYFKDEINRILNNNAYVTEYELKNYIDSIIRQKLTTCSLNEVGEGVYEFKLPMNNPRVLNDFLTTYQPFGEENDVAFGNFKRKIEGATTLRITFNQTKAYEDRHLLFLNIYHPLIQACLEFFIKCDDKSKTTFCYALKGSQILSKDKSYFLALYQLITHRIVQGVEKHSESLFPILYDVKKGAIVKDRTIVEAVFSKSQIDGIEHNPSNEDVLSELMTDMRYNLAEYIDGEISKKLSELKKMAASERLRSEQETRVYYDSRIANYERRRSEQEDELQWHDPSSKDYRKIENTVRLMKANISIMEKEMEDHLQQINQDPKIGIDKEVISINLIKII